MVKKILWGLLVISLPSMATQDPTAPLNWKETNVVTEEADSPLPSLQSIVCDEHAKCYAIVNNQIVSKGDRVDDYVVKAINVKNLTLQKGQEQWKLALFSLDIKK